MAVYKAQVFGTIDTKARLSPLYALFVPIIALILLMFTQFFSLLGAGAVGISLIELEESSTKSLIYILFVSFGLASLAAFAWVKFVESRSLVSMGWRFERAWSRYSRGFLIGLMLNVAAITIIAAAGGYEVGKWFAALTNPAALVLIIVFMFGFIIQGGTEEVLFRGWVMSSMAARWGIPIAVGVSSSLFAALHLANEWPHVNWIAMANIVLVGVFFAIFAIRERSLLGVCAAHSSWNWIMSVGFGLNVSGMKIDAEPLLVSLQQKTEMANWITGGSFGPEGSLAVTIVLGVATLLVWRWQGDAQSQRANKGE